MGRLLMRAALAGLRQEVNYEAQAAIEFEAALDPLENRRVPLCTQGKVVDVEEAFQALVVDSISGVVHPIISARFHNGLVEMSGRYC